MHVVYRIQGFVIGGECFKKGWLSIPPSDGGGRRPPGRWFPKSIWPRRCVISMSATRSRTLAARSEEIGTHQYHLHWLVTRVGAHNGYNTFYQAFLKYCRNLKHTAGTAMVHAGIGANLARGWRRHIDGSRRTCDSGSGDMNVLVSISELFCEQAYVRRQNKSADTPALSSLPRRMRDAPPSRRARTRRALLGYERYNPPGEVDENRSSTGRV